MSEKELKFPEIGCMEGEKRCEESSSVEVMVKSEIPTDSNVTLWLSTAIRV